MSKFVSKKVIEAMKHNATVALHNGQPEIYYPLMGQIAVAEKEREEHIKKHLTGKSILVSEVAVELRNYGLRTTAQHINSVLIELGLQVCIRRNNVNSYEMTPDSLDMAMALVERTSPTTTRLRWDSSIVEVVADVLMKQEGV